AIYLHCRVPLRYVTSATHTWLGRVTASSLTRLPAPAKNRPSPGKRRYSVAEHARTPFSRISRSTRRRPTASPCPRPAAPPPAAGPPLRPVAAALRALAGFHTSRGSGHERRGSPSAAARRARRVGSSAATARRKTRSRSLRTTRTSLGSGTLPAGLR